MPRHGDHGRRLSAAERAALLARVAAGDTHAMAAAAMGCSTKSIQRLFVHTGGLAPRRRRRSPLRLSLGEREDISRGLETGASSRAIARGLGRAPSTITRDIAANGGRTDYRAWQAERRANAHALRPKLAKLARCARLRAALRLVNASAAASLLEGLEETLTLHRLGVFPQLGISFKTTNLLESMMARVEARTARVDHWRTSDQKQRWCAAALLAVEAQFRRVKGYQHLPRLVAALATKNELTRDAA